VVAWVCAASSASVASISASSLQRLDRVAGFGARALDLQAAGHRVGVVLQADDPQHVAGQRIQQDQATAQEFRRSRIAAHFFLLPKRQVKVAPK
jgi:hypothetical protein